MSHTSEVELVVKDLDCLKTAAENLGLEMVKKTSFKAYFENQGRNQCEHVLRIPGNTEAFEIGVAPGLNKGNYKLLTDFYNGGRGMEAKVGRNADKLKQAYSQAYLTKNWRRQGYRVTQTTKENGELVVKATR